MLKESLTSTLIAVSIMAIVFLALYYSHFQSLNYTR